MFAVSSLVCEGSVTFPNGKAFQLMPAYGVLHAVHTVAVDIVLDERGGMYEMTERSYSYPWYVVSASDNNKDSELRYCG